MASTPDQNIVSVRNSGTAVVDGDLVALSGTNQAALRATEVTGSIADTSAAIVSGTLARVMWYPENLAVAADGAA